MIRITTIATMLTSTTPLILIIPMYHKCQIARNQYHSTVTQKEALGMTSIITKSSILIVRLASTLPPQIRHNIKQIVLDSGATDNMIPSKDMFEKISYYDKQS